MGSQIVAVRSAVIDGLTATYGTSSLDGVDVKFNWQAKWSRRERVWTTRARFTHTTAALTAGKNIRDERASFDLAIWAELPGKSVEEAADRAMEISLVLEDFIADHKNNNDNFWTDLGVVGLNWIVVEGDGEMSEGPGDSSSIATLSLPISYSARLT